MIGGWFTVAAMPARAGQTTVKTLTDNKGNEIMRMNKLILATVLATISAQSMAALTSHGTATTSIVLNAGADWSIRKGVDAEGTLGSGNVYTNDDILNHKPTIIIKNGTATAGTYYIRGAGASLASDGTIRWYNDADNSKVARFPAPGTALGGTWNGEESAYKSNAELAAGAEKTFELTMLDGAVVEPGTWNMTLELFTKTP
ncbi:hypothetical protein BTJ39_17280 [Izhakiella australiensis]|uniref:Uncharacterized protein n=2 Tax=Izhakiella australiensis TaxID=1926881 RepID=A0A1S8YI78_9GAMM|nr:hypothetical protein BTJ39_17280 [Izhakiella australiensis]